MQACTEFHTSILNSKTFHSSCLFFGWDQPETSADTVLVRGPENGHEGAMLVRVDICLYLFPG